MQSEIFPGEYIQRRLFVEEIKSVDGGFNSYNFPAPANHDLTAPANILDSFCASSLSTSFDLRRRFETETFPDEKTLAALRNHKEAEKRRRERINSHLDRLRSLLPCSTKTDKATLLAKVVERVRELNESASEMMKSGGNYRHLIPSEKDELSIDDVDGELTLRASLCCVDRTDLFTDLAEVVSSLQLKTIRAEMSTIGGRTRNSLVVTGERCSGRENLALIYDAFKGIVQRSGSEVRSKRRRRMETQFV